MRFSWEKKKKIKLKKESFYDYCMRCANQELDRVSTWHAWFAWHPIKIGSEWIWLEQVERRYPCAWVGAYARLYLEYAEYRLKHQ